MNVNTSQHGWLRFVAFVGNITWLTAVNRKSRGSASLCLGYGVLNVHFACAEFIKNKTKQY